MSSFAGELVPTSFIIPHSPEDGINYTSFNRYNLNLPKSFSIHPENPASPLNGLLKGDEIKIKISDESTSREAFIKDAIVTPAQIELTLEDDIDRKLQKPQVLADYSGKTPAELIRLLCQAYNIELELSTYGIAHSEQLKEGLIFNLIVGVEDNKKLIDIFNELLVAGFMRACIYLNKLWLFYRVDQNAPTQINRNEIQNLPTNKLSTEQSAYSGGEIAWEFGTIQSAGIIGKEFNKDYQNGNLILVNPNGALSLIELYSNKKKVVHQEFEIRSDIIKTKQPGEAISIEHEHEQQNIIGSLVGLKRKNNVSKKTSIATIERNVQT